MCAHLVFQADSTPRSYSAYNEHLCLNTFGDRPKLVVLRSLALSAPLSRFCFLSSPSIHCHHAVPPLRLRCLSLFSSYDRCKRRLPRLASRSQRQRVYHIQGCRSTSIHRLTGAVRRPTHPRQPLTFVFFRQTHPDRLCRLQTSHLGTSRLHLRLLETRPLDRQPPGSLVTRLLLVAFVKTFLLRLLTCRSTRSVHI